MAQSLTSESTSSIKVCTWPLAIRDYFQKSDVQYRSIFHPRTTSLKEAAVTSGVEPLLLIRAVMLFDDQGLIMAIIPGHRMLDFSALCEITKRDLKPASPEQLEKVFLDCEPGSYPPLPAVYRLESLVDASVLEQSRVYFEPGIHEILIEMDIVEFQKVIGDRKIGSFSSSIEHLAEQSFDLSELHTVIHRFVPNRMKDRLEETFELPSLPPITGALLRLRGDPDQDPNKLAAIVEKDPSLCLQLISWAQSPFYGYPGTVDSIQQAIVKVLGFDLVMNLALGISVGRSMRMPVDGPLGLKAFWQFSMFSAYLAVELSDCMPRKYRPSRGLVYLAGLLHNIGYLILSEVFPPQFYLLNRYVMVNPHVPINQIEHHVLGVRHEQIGAWLMESWHLPPEMIAAVKWHHEGEFVHEHGVYANLVLVATRLLYQVGIGDAGTEVVPQAVLESLEITQEQAQLAFEDVMSYQDAINSLVNQLSP